MSGCLSNMNQDVCAQKHLLNANWDQFSHRNVIPGSWFSVQFSAVALCSTIVSKCSAEIWQRCFRLLRHVKNEERTESKLSFCVTHTVSWSALSFLWVSSRTQTSDPHASAKNDNLSFSCQQIFQSRHRNCQCWITYCSLQSAVFNCTQVNSASAPLLL